MAIGKTKYLPMRFHGLESEVESLRNYVLTMEAAIRREQKGLDKYAEEQKQKLDDAQYAEFLEFEFDRFRELHDHIPRLMRESTFVVTMSFLENDLVGLCRVIKRQKHLHAGFQKLKGKTSLESVRDYIFTQTGIDIGVRRYWKTLDTLNTIRNSIVHSAGHLSHKKDQVKNYARRNSKVLGISGRRKFPRNRVELREEFLQHTLNVLAKYSKEAYKRLMTLGI